MIVIIILSPYFLEKKKALNNVYEILLLYIVYYEGKFVQMSCTFSNILSPLYKVVASKKGRAYTFESQEDMFFLFPK